MDHPERPAALPLKAERDRTERALACWPVADEGRTACWPGITPVKMSSAEFGSFVVKQIDDWAPAIKAADVKN